MAMMAQPVRDVAEDEEDDGVSAVVQVAWPGHDREQPGGDHDDGDEPGIEGKLESLDFGLPYARPEAVALVEGPWPAQGVPDLTTEAGEPGRPVGHVWHC